MRGDAASAAKAISTFNRETQLLEFKGGVMNGETLEVEEIKAIAKLPSRDVLYGQLVGMIASPITGLARSLGGLLGGLAIALGELQEQEGVRRGAGGRAARAGRGSGRGGAPAEAEAEEAPAEEAPEAEAPAEEAAADAEPEAEARRGARGSRRRGTRR